LKSDKTYITSFYTLSSSSKKNERGRIQKPGQSKHVVRENKWQKKGEVENIESHEISKEKG